MIKIRPHIKYYTNLYRTLLPVLFWTKCESCEKDFRFRKGWRALVGPYCDGMGKWVYICPFCAPDKEKASALFFDRDEKISKNRLPPPPPPPIGQGGSKGRGYRYHDNN